MKGKKVHDKKRKKKKKRGKKQRNAKQKKIKNDLTQSNKQYHQLLYYFICISPPTDAEAIPTNFCFHSRATSPIPRLPITTIQMTIIHWDKDSYMYKIKQRNNTGY